MSVLGRLCLVCIWGGGGVGCRSLSVSGRAKVMRASDQLPALARGIAVVLALGLRGEVWHWCTRGRDACNRMAPVFLAVATVQSASCVYTVLHFTSCVYN